MKDLGAQMKKHLSLHAAQRLVSTAKEHLSTAAFRLLHNAKEQDHGLPHEGRGYDDIVIKQIYRAVNALEKAAWELHRRNWRHLGLRVEKSSGKKHVDLPEASPNLSDFAKYLPKLKETSVPWDGLTQVSATLKDTQTFFAGLTGWPGAEGDKLQKQVKKSLDFLEAVMEKSEEDAP